MRKVVRQSFDELMPGQPRKLQLEFCSRSECNMDSSRHWTPVPGLEIIGGSPRMLTKLLHFAREINWPPTIAAIGIGVSLVAAWWTHQQRATFDMIDRIYELCHRLHAQLQAEWRLSHLFCIGATVYPVVRERIAAAVGDDRAQLIERERLFAIQVLIAYEQAYYQWRKSSRLLWNRRRFLRDMLDYFLDRLLANPRLRSYLESDRCGCSLHLEKPSANFLWQEIEKHPPVAADNTGPFNYVVPQVPGHSRSA